MAGAGDIRAGKATVELFADNNALSRGLKAADASLKSWGKSINKVGQGIAALGTASMAADMAKITAAFGAAVEFGNVGAELQHMSERTGIAVESLSLLKFAAEQSGIGLEDLEMGIKKMQKAIVAGSPALGKLGLSAMALKNMAPEAALDKIANKLAEIENPTKRAALAMAIFGKSGTAMLPMLSGGAAGLENMKAVAKAAGLEMSGEDATSAVKFKQALGLLNAQLKQVVITIGSAVAPYLSEMMAKTTPIIKGVIDWIKANKALAWSLVQSAAVGVALGAIVVGLGTAIVGLAATFAVVGSIIGVIATVIGAAWAIITTPILLVSAILGYMVVRGAVLSGIFEGWGAAFSSIGQTFGVAWGGIIDALQSGKIELAGKIAFAGLEVVWMQVLDAMRESWRKFEDDVINSKSTFGKILNFVSPAFGALLAMNHAKPGGSNDTADARKRLEDAKKELIVLSTQAATARASQASGVGAIANASRGTLGGLGDIAKTTGTFNKYALDYMGGGSESTRQTDLLGKIAEGIGQLIDIGENDAGEVYG